MAGARGKCLLLRVYESRAAILFFIGAKARVRRFLANFADS